jgi:hypothetical protein
MSNKEYDDFLKKYAANIERFRRVGIHPFGFSPGYLCRIEGAHESVDIPDELANIILELIKKVHPEMADDKAMIRAYKLREAKEQDNG